MTGGSAIILGSIGDNFGAGMTGGSSFIYSDQTNLLEMMNKENIDTYQVIDEGWKNFLLKILVDFNKQTKSKRAAYIIENFDQENPMFSCLDVVRYLRANPKLVDINREVTRKGNS